MDFIYTPPPLPTIARWRDNRRKFPGTSVLRALEYEKLLQTSIQGKVLDIGGGENAPYKKYLSEASVVHSVNIDPKIEPTHLLKPGEAFPFADQSYDNAVCFNTLEHVYDAKFVIDEILRVLKPGGTLHITVPFMFRIHGHPDDFFRATPSWWRETLHRAGFSRTELQPLVWGRYTTGGMITGYRGLFPRMQFHIAHLKDWLYAKAVFRGNSYDGRRGERICAISAGWFISGTR
jgi:SAM-dependent methyltransferase